MSFLVKFLLIIIPALVVVAFFTVMERVLLGGMQRRRGPNRVGINGMMQAFADGLKLFIKEILIPGGSSFVLYIFASVFCFGWSLVTWGLFPFMDAGVFVDYNLGVLLWLTLTSFNVYGILFAG